MTIIIPQPVIPAGMTVIEAIARGYLPAQVRVLRGGSGPPDTLHALIASGVISHGTMASTLVYELVGNPAIHVFYATYGGY